MTGYKVLVYMSHLSMLLYNMACRDEISIQGKTKATTLALKTDLSKDNCYLSFDAGPG